MRHWPPILRLGNCPRWINLWSVRFETWSISAACSRVKNLSSLEVPAMDIKSEQQECQGRGVVQLYVLKEITVRPD